MDYERERRRQKRYREAMRNRIIAAVLLAGIIVGAIFIIKGTIFFWPPKTMWTRSVA